MKNRKPSEGLRFFSLGCRGVKCVGERAGGSLSMIEREHFWNTFRSTGRGKKYDLRILFQ